MVSVRESERSMRKEERETDGAVLDQAWDDKREC